jgi:hypothetical protein
MTQDINKDCAVRFERLDNEHASLDRRLQKIETAIEGNGKSGLKDDVAAVKRDVEDSRAAIYEQDRYLERIEKQVKEIKATLDSSSEGDKNRKLDITKAVMSNGMTFVTMVVNILLIYLIWRVTGQLP